MRVVTLVGLPLLLAAICRGQATLPSVEDGAVAPRNCWTTAGGSASRSGAADGDPVRGPVEIAWRFPKDAPVKGVIEGEPLVWDNRVLVSVRDSDERRTIHVLDLLDGKPVTRTASFQTKMPLEPSIWNGVVVLRAAPNRIEAWRLRGRDFEKMPWLFQSKSPLSAPVLLGREVYVRNGNSLARLSLSRAVPVWEKTGQFTGSPSVRGRYVYAVDYGNGGISKLVWHRRTDGARAGEAPAGQHDGGVVAPESAATSVTVLDACIAVVHGVPILTDQGPATLAAFTRSVTDDGAVVITAIGTLPMRSGSGMGSIGKRYLIGVDDPGGPKLVSFEKGLTKGIVLADRNLFAEFVAESCPPSSWNGVTMIGANAVDETSQRILWSQPLRASARAVPARDTVLLVEGGNRLVAVRGTSRSKGIPRIVPAAGESRPGEPLAIGSGRAVLRDGTVVEAGFVLDLGRGVLTKDGAPKAPPWKLEDVLLLEDSARRMIFAGSGDAAVRGVGHLAEHGLGDAYAALAVEADKSQDAALVERLIGEAWERGATGKDLTRAEAKLRERLTQKAAPNAGEVERILKKEKSILAEPANVVWERFKALPASASWSLRSDLLGAVLARDPTHRDAQLAVRAELPKGVEPPDPFEAAEWLDFIDAVRQTPIDVVPPPKPEEANPSHAQRELGAACASWRPDLVAIQSKSLLIITPVREPGRIARCLSAGELVCETLEALFAGGAVKRDKRHPIRLMLYETKREYEEQSARSGYAEGSHLAWTEGHYSPLEQVARMYLPKGKAGFERILDVYAHEMTHAWIEERCPLFGSAERGIGRRMAPGDWIVEGFATLIENFEFDLEARTFRIKDQTTPLEIVANAKPDDLLPWVTLYRATPAYMHSLDPKPQFVIPSRWILGAGYTASKINLFYSQAGATCLYLFQAESGKYRSRLIKYVGDHYGARRDQLDIQTAFEIAPDELGARVLEYAKSVASHGKKR